MKKTMIALLTLFFAFMAAITVWSCISYQNSLPQVELFLPHTGDLTIGHTKNGRVEIIEQSGEYTCQTQVSLSKDECFGHFLWMSGEQVSVAFSETIVCDGFILDVSTLGEEYLVTVGFSYDKALVDEEVTVSFRKTYPELDNLVPIETIHGLDPASGQGWLYTIAKQQGAWGDVYIVEKEAVTVIFTDGTNAYLSGFVCRQPIVLSSDLPLGEGMEVRFPDR